MPTRSIRAVRSGGANRKLGRRRERALAPGASTRTYGEVARGSGEEALDALRESFRLIGKQAVAGAFDALHGATRHGLGHARGQLAA